MTEQQLKDQIKHLVELQKIDSKIYRMKQDVQSIPSQKKTAEEAFQKHKAQLADAEKHYKDKQMRQKELENEVLAKEELIKKYQSQQAQVKTNQEYSALTKEINDATADKSIAEDEVLRIMDEVENEKKVLDDEKARLAGEEKKLKEELKKHDETQQGLQKEIEALNGERKQFMPSVDPEILSQYELVLQKRGGIAVAALQGESCGGCSLNFPPQVVNEIKLQEKIIFCESCSRIVYDESSL